MTARPKTVFLFAMPRSGSTLLCDLLTAPGKSVVLHEPMVLRRFGDGRGPRIHQMLRSIGIEVDPPAKNFERGTPAQAWFDQQVLPAFSDLDFWGLKEVFLSDAEQLIEAYSPELTLLLWRDPRDVALSMLELMNRSLMSFADRSTLKDEAWALECLCESAEVLYRLSLENPAGMIRYEDLMQSSECRQRLLDQLGMSEFGDANFSMIEDKSGVRNAEVSRHTTSWSTQSLGRFEQEASGWRSTFAKVCHAAMNSHAAHAGYDQASLTREQVCAEPTASTSIRVNDPSYLPKRGFDFCYARRRARQYVAPMLKSGQRVLDVGASTASLVFMANHADVTVVDDGHPGKRVISKPWRDGVFPPLESFDTITFLFSLEYVRDPLLIVKRLLDRRKRILITYHCRDDLSPQIGSELEFTSHLAREDWKRFASDGNLVFTSEWAFDGFQSLIELAPVDA